MVRIDALIFGYRKLKIDPSDLSLVTSLLLRNSIPSIINNDGTITVRERDIKRIQNIFFGRIDYSCSDSLGLPEIFKRIKYKGTVAISLLISLIVTLFLSGLIWDIRVEGNEKITDGEIILALGECGFEIGDMWRLVDRGEVENDFLKNNSSISWININRRGSVAYIKVIEKENNQGTADNSPSTYSNLIASSDCVIEEITVMRGTAMVKVGDTVKRGDILVAGVLSAEAGGGFCSAEATVIGRKSDTVTVEIERIGEKISYGEKKLYSKTINFFKISLNIFKLYGNLTDECDIIEDEVAYSLFGRYKLPLSISSVYLVNKCSESVEYTDDELVKIATERMNAITASLLAGGDLLRIKTQGDFGDRGYWLSSDIVFLCDVGERAEFDVE